MCFLLVLLNFMASIFSDILMRSYSRSKHNHAAGLYVLLNIYSESDVVERVNEHLLCAEYDALDRSMTMSAGLRELRKNDALVLADYQALLWS